MINQFFLNLSISGVYLVIIQYHLKAAAAEEEELNLEYYLTGFPNDSGLWNHNFLLECVRLSTEIYPKQYTTMVLMVSQSLTPAAEETI